MASIAQRTALSSASASRCSPVQGVAPRSAACSPSAALRCPATATGRTVRDVSAAAVRRSPVIAPDVRVGRGDEEAYVDLRTYLLRQRIVFLSGYVNDKIATQVVGSLLALAEVDDKTDIKLYINCNGGQPYSIFGVLDTIKSIKPDVQTYALGACYSYASMILASGAKGKRHAMKNTRIMMSQPMGGSAGDMYAVEKTVQELNAIYQMVARYYMEYTGMDQDQVEKNTCRDNFMTPEEAQISGLVDHVLGGEDDLYVPHSVQRKFANAGLLDNLSSGLL
ncbi:hypothetical protein FOA52_005656 [Chlamydomonas sp. UWO 241]|nr:hypothetical protein FOA52_005656 [Chlamydomonas sp. UWO 241]